MPSCSWTLKVCLLSILLASSVCSRRIIAQGTSDQQVEYALTAGVSEPDKALRVYRELRIPDDIADAYVHGDYLGPGRLSWVHLKNIQQQPLRMLFLPCGTLDQARVYLYSFSGDHWHLLDHRDFDCHYDEDVNFELLNVTSPHQYDIMVHHDCSGHGTGYLEQSVWLFRVSGLKLSPVLTETEVLHEFLIGPGPNHGHEEKSAFLPIRPGTIEQTQIRTSFGEGSEEFRLGSTTVRRRDFVWNREKAQFVRTKWLSIQ